MLENVEEIRFCLFQLSIFQPKERNQEFQTENASPNKTFFSIETLT